MPSRRDCLRGMAGLGVVGLAGCTDDEPVSGRWPRSGYDNRNTSDLTDQSGPGTDLSKAWTAHLPGGSHSSTPVLTDGQLILGHGASLSTDEPYEVGFRVFDARTGSETRSVTATTYRGDHPDATLYRDSLVVQDGAAYLLAYDGIHSYTLGGEERWHRPVDGSPNWFIHQSGHPVVHDDVVYAPTASITERTDAPEGLLAIDDATGELLWRYEVSDDADLGWTFAPAFDDGLVFVALATTGVVALDAATGDVEWSTQLRVNGPPTVSGGRVFVPGEVPGGSSGRDDADEYRTYLAALDAGSGEESWREVEAGERYGRELAAANGHVYARERMDSIVCRDAESGTERWRYTDAPFVLPGRPVVTEGALYIVVDRSRRTDSGVVALDPDSGNRLGFAASGTSTANPAHLAAGEDWLFVATGGNAVLAFEPCSLEVRGRCLY